MMHLTWTCDPSLAQVCVSMIQYGFQERPLCL